MYLIKQLAKQMYLRKENRERPYILFLGAGISVSSGISNMNDMIDRFLTDTGNVSRDDLDKMDKDQRFEKFFLAIQNLSEVDRYHWLRDGFKNAAPSFGYQALTKLIEDGYIDTIFTTNWDELLEMSLMKSNKIKEKKDYRIYARGVDRDDFIISQFRSHAFPSIKIVKLHGELESRVILVTPQETSEFPTEFARFFREEIFRSRDIIMVGYSVSDQDVKNCMEPEHNSLYYVNPKPPNDDLLKKFNHLEQITGDDINFDTFMSNLAEAISQEEIRMRAGVPDKLLEKFSEDIQKIREDFDLLVEFLKNPKMN